VATFDGGSVVGAKRWCIRGAQAAAHRRWRGVGGAFRRAGCWQRRWRQHVSGTMVGALSGRWAVAAQPWVGGGELAMMGRRWRRLGNNSTTNLTVMEVKQGGVNDDGDRRIAMIADAALALLTIWMVEELTRRRHRCHRHPQLQ